MRIAVIGPQNTGKSTFIQDFVSELSDYSTPKETYRDVVNNLNLEINQKTSVEAQEAILNFLYDLIVNNLDKNILFDRCVIDNYIYSLAADLDKSFLLITHRKMLDHLKHLDMIFFIPAAVAVNLVEDELRDTDRVYIDKVNRLFMETLFYISNISNIPIRVISGDRKERLEIARSILY